MFCTNDNQSHSDISNSAVITNLTTIATPLIYNNRINSTAQHSTNTMAQGSGKFGNAGGRKKSAGSQRRKTVRVAKKRNKGSSMIETKDRGIVAATKQINRKNERLIAAKATSAHTKFYLKDLSDKGTYVRLSF